MKKKRGNYIRTELHRKEKSIHSKKYWTEDARKKQSILTKKMWKDPEYRKIHILGKKHTEESKRKIGEGIRRMWKDPEYRRRHTLGKMGKATKKKGRKYPGSMKNSPTIFKRGHIPAFMKKMGNKYNPTKHPSWKGWRITKHRISGPGNTYKKILLEETGGKCQKCGFSDKRALDLSHKNGDSRDNRKENLQILCANCHRIYDSKI